MKISLGSSTSWMMRSSSRVGTLVSPATREMSRSNWHISLISSGVLPGWQVSRYMNPSLSSKRNTPAVLITAEGPPRKAAPYRSRRCTHSPPGHFFTRQPGLVM